MKVIKFLMNHSPYVAGEIASFSDEDADVRIQAGVAELVKHYTIQPDQRTEVKVDEFGKTVMETKIVPDDLERNVDLPPTPAGGQPKDEGHMTDEEKAHVSEYEKTGVDPERGKANLDEEPSQPDDQPASKSVDQPTVSKMVKGAPAKK